MEEDYEFIRHVPERTIMSVNDSIQRTGVDAILIGTNRDRSLNDIPQLMIYNGKSFDMHSQEDKGE
jgi:hypothetical protein